MFCKNCGSKIEDNLRFCGSCGSKVDAIEETPIVEEVVDVIEEIPTVNEVVDMEETRVMEPVLPIEESVTENNVEEVVEQLPGVENESTKTESEEVVIQPSTPVQDKKPKKKNNTLLFTVIGVLLVIIGAVLVYFTLNKGTSSNVEVLEKALGNFETKGKESGTVDVKLLLGSDEQNTMNFSATFKYAKQNNNDYNYSLTLNKSMFFDEISVYSTYINKDLMLYANSNLIDMLGLTSSPSSMWVHMLMTAEELQINNNTNTENNNLNSLKNLLDEEHFKFIGKETNLRHYQLVIDNELLNVIKSQENVKENLKGIEDSLSSVYSGSTELSQTVYLDVYINESNELVKLSMNLSNLLEDSTMNKMELSIEFSNLGKTLVQIPNEVKNSTIDLETYMETYAIVVDENGIDSNLDELYGDESEYEFEYSEESITSILP